eukprot:708500-Rhodomonas_salina.3
MSRPETTPCARAKKEEEKTWKSSADFTRSLVRSGMTAGATPSSLTCDPGSGREMRTQRIGLKDRQRGRRGRKPRRKTQGE